MADIPVSDVDSVGGVVFSPKTEITSITTALGASGEIFNVTPGGDNILRVLRLSAGLTVKESNMTVEATTIDGDVVTLLDDGTLNEAQPNGDDFYIGRYSIANLNNGAGGLAYLDCKNITVTKTVGSTVEPISISYIEGVVS